jgi:hypothetical protein
MTEGMREIMAYAKTKIEQPGIRVVHETTVSLYDCQVFFHKAGGPPPNPENRNVYMKPDGGVLFAVLETERIPLMIMEDKVQGTNDTRRQEGLLRQSTGNAIERGAKNIRGAEMIFANVDIFPYVLFASGCDFHSSETIAKRIEMMNMGVPNHYVNVSMDDTDDTISNKVDRIIENIDIRKKGGRSIASVFVKAHKWDEMDHGASLWKKDEIVKVGTRIIDLVVDVVFPSLS